MSSFSLGEERLAKAKSLIASASRHQEELLGTPISREFIEGATPVVWLGEAVPGSWVTMATNPSPKEFINQNNQLLLGEQARFHIRENGQSLAEYAKDEAQLESAIEYYQTYFKAGKAYRTWFGKPDGAKLEGFLNGLGGSFYGSPGFKNVIHSDFFPFATRTHMGRIKEKLKLLGSDFSREFLQEKLEFLRPSMVILLGREHCALFEKAEPGIKFDPPKALEPYPGAAYQTGFHQRLRIPLLGLHFKPSEQFLGLGGGQDKNGQSHGKYGTKAALNELGRAIARDLQSFTIG
ncbi:hypothetical protein CEF21_01160 [Bacillus sp. FJAT-42376]|uniref:hypothetical protein n=1 Tax=Bacillus sp. FJAT-42376 TaxID=2014076 RepID=UPI000F4E170A|nr:hypothetical protein [Bacillus sp. FJAT-42376]AZB41059.1 hypothetical protein CEF21_01160 [Bacillus sp. FJAT-42376]